MLGEVDNGKPAAILAVQVDAHSRPPIRRAFGERGQIGTGGIRDPEQAARKHCYNLMHRAILLRSDMRGHAPVVGVNPSTDGA